MRFALFKNGGMAEWLKASRLKRDSRRSWDVGSATRRGGGESEHILLLRRRRKKVCKFKGGSLKPGGDI